jgi:hypothetical protein
VLASCRAAVTSPVGRLRGRQFQVKFSVDLEQALRQLGQAAEKSVQSRGWVGRAHSLQDRLTEADMQKIIQSFESGTPRWQLAEHYAISVTSVERARSAASGA